MLCSFRPFFQLFCHLSIQWLLCIYYSIFALIAVYFGNSTKLCVHLTSTRSFQIAIEKVDSLSIHQITINCNEIRLNKENFSFWCTPIKRNTIEIKFNRKKNHFNKNFIKKMSIFVILWCIRHIHFVDVLLHLVWFYRMNWNLLYAFVSIFYKYLYFHSKYTWNRSTQYLCGFKRKLYNILYLSFFISTHFYSINALFWQNLARSIFILIFNDKTRNQFLSCNNFQSDSSRFFLFTLFLSMQTI